MSLFGHLLGKIPPVVPVGGQAFASDDDGHGTAWSVRVAMNGEDPTSKCQRISPVFALQTTAYAYLDWVTGASPTFAYPAGKA